MNGKVIEILVCFFAHLKGTVCRRLGDILKSHPSFFGKLGGGCFELNVAEMACGLEFFGLLLEQNILPLKQHMVCGNDS